MTILTCVKHPLTSGHVELNITHTATAEDNIIFFQFSINTVIIITIGKHNVKLSGQLEAGQSLCG